MKKFLLSAFILFDLALIGGSVFVLYTYLSRRPSLAAPSAASAPASTPSTASVTAPAAGEAAATAPAVPP
jgi:uncharacterized iron-regulated membrane protein